MIAIAVAAFVLAFLGMGVIHGNDPGVKEKFAARDAIELCRKGERDELAPIDVRRFTRQVCDNMSADFVKKYGHRP